MVLLAPLSREGNLLIVPMLFHPCLENLSREFLVLGPILLPCSAFSFSSTRSVVFPSPWEVLLIIFGVVSRVCLLISPKNGNSPAYIWTFPPELYNPAVASPHSTGERAGVSKTLSPSSLSFNLPAKSPARQVPGPRFWVPNKW